ncbi:8074_t:CDS:2 [Paraglomus occultum]|uniref:8074_t:CDS:1 n=1 Tax=Paraglomus occultum TaxID=144539 RepID=A0A9N9FQ17_9GLOM|nr:8074_t:CDS:2 [Paraglomus occultum]
MTDLQPLYRDYFDETSVEEWSYLHFLKSFESVIMANIDATKDGDKGTWGKDS